MANTVDPDETAQCEPSHLDLQCLQIQLLLCLALYGLTLSGQGLLAQTLIKIVVTLRIPK